MKIDHVYKQQLKPEGDFWHCNVIPVGPFLDILKAPDEFAAALAKKGKEVVDEWVKTNKSIKNPKEREVAEKHFILQSHSFRGQRGAVEHSQIVFQLSLWGYTKMAQKVDKPDPPLLRDVKVAAAFTLFFARSY